MNDLLLTLNAGSSTLKFALFEAVGLVRVAGGSVEGIGTGEGRLHLGGRDERVRSDDHAHALSHVLDWMHARGDDRYLFAAGHRVVHGGPRHTSPVRIDDRVCAELAKLIPLAPLHQPHNLAAITALRQLQPGLPQVACFDTAFHRTQPELAQRYALPRGLSDAGILRYGFHGISYEYIAEALPRLAGAMPPRTIVAHLGNGASLCALAQGRSIATTMGFTPLDGVPMGTRPGHLDPGIVLYLLKELGQSAAEIEHTLYHESGLLGVSGISSDMRTLLASDDARAREAVDLFVYRVGREIGSLAAALGGLDALVFTAGIGEHAAPIRARICESAAWLGAVCDHEANTAGHARIDAKESRVSLWVIPTDEESMIARHTRKVVTGN